MNKFLALITKYGSKILTVVTAVTVAAMLAYSAFALYDSVYTNRAAFS